MARMEAPDSGVKVRMYRQGHGDCFLLAFRDDNGDPFYLLIDCGVQSRSQVHHDIEDIVEDIAKSTANHINVVMISHEHEDHVNGFWYEANNEVHEYFDGIDVDHLWVAWTEDPGDSVANDLRDRHGDILLGLMGASEQLAAAADPTVQAVGRRIEALLAFETGDREMFLRRAIAGEKNKLAIKYIKDKTDRDPLYLRPKHPPYELPDVSGVRIFALGPPRDNEDLLLSPDPAGGEGYSKRFAMARDAESFLTAALRNSQNPALNKLAENSDDTQQPFSPRYRIPESQAGEGSHADFFGEYYGAAGTDHAESWRQIDYDWLRTAETLALRLNNGVNNTSLVTAIELPNTKKVLLFTGDAQRGNWISWVDQDWTGENDQEITARELLGRTVLYKVGHHGSHNATLKGYPNSDYPNLSWMARDNYQDDFVAMIPANRHWAYNKKPRWKHPLRSIEQALSKKAKGRVFRIDVDHVAKPSGVTQSQWQPFEDRTTETDLYFEYWIPD